MATPCPHENAPDACLNERSRRFREHRPDIRPWATNPCELCKVGRVRAEAPRSANKKEETESRAARPGIRAWRELGRREKQPNENDYHNEKEGAAVATDKKDVILKRIENEKRCTKSRLMNFCGATADQVASATKVLEAEGKIKVWPGIREGAVIYTLPGISKDYEGTPVKASNDATRPLKPPRCVNRTPATPPYKPRAKSQKPIGRTNPTEEVPIRPALKSLFEVDLRFVGILQERTGRLMGAIASESPIDGELLDLFCLTTDWLRERRATA